MASTPNSTSGGSSGGRSSGNTSKTDGKGSKGSSKSSSRGKSGTSKNRDPIEALANIVPSHHAHHGMAGEYSTKGKFSNWHDGEKSFGE